MAVSRILAVLVWVGLVVFAAESSAQQAMMLPVDPAPLVAETQAGEKSFSIEIADDDLEREMGLMFRQSMDDRHGMLFVFPQTRPVGFWMKNTPMPLDLVFIDEAGKVDAIRRGEPFSQDLIAPNGPVRFVLELKAGVAARSGIAAGDRIRHPEIDEVAGSGG
jgi:uncharacterized protein